MKKEVDPQYIRSAVRDLIERQVRDGAPPEVGGHVERLIGEGFLHEEAVTLIGSVLSRELFHALDRGLPFDERHYVAALAVLPALPWE